MCIRDRLYTCPALFDLMLLHIFLIPLMIMGCTDLYSFLPVLSIVFHIVSVYSPAWCTVCHMAVRETFGWSYAPYLFLYENYGYHPQPHSGYLLFCNILQSIWSLCESSLLLHSAFSYIVSGYVLMILDILFLFSIAAHTIQTVLRLSLYESIFPENDIFFLE